MPGGGWVTLASLLCRFGICVLKLLPFDFLQTIRKISDDKFHCDHMRILFSLAIRELSFCVVQILSCISCEKSCEESM